MKNKEKYAEQIVDIACNGDSIAVVRSTGNLDHVVKRRAENACLILVHLHAKTKQENGLILSMLRDL